MSTNKHELNDLFLISYLFLRDFKPIARRSDEQRAIFTFELSPQLREEIENYYSQKTSVDALSLFEKYRVVFLMAKQTRAEVR
jgi:hypothetical protein